ncbi:hypothetical protein, partial [Riemerella anatipestifer]
YYIKKSNSLSKSYNFSGEIIGASEDLYINNSVKIATGVIFDTSEGPIFIDKNVKISPFSYLKGPLFVGENTSIKDARIYGGVIIGKNCKIAGELENVIIGDFTNKSHESALIHSYVGDWCNIAGYTKTADLNVDYSTIKVKLFDNIIIDTKKQKFGAIINDFVRIGGGVLIYPGTFIDFGSTVIELPKLSGYYNPFTRFERGKFYEIDVFFNEVEIFMKRREVFPSSNFRSRCVDIFNEFSLKSV